MVYDYDSPFSEEVDALVQSLAALLPSQMDFTEVKVLPEAEDDNQT